MIVNVLVPSDPGAVPVIAPVLVFKLKPVGKLPLVRLYVIVPSPVALTVCEYAPLVGAAVIAPLAVTQVGNELKIIPIGFTPLEPSVLYNTILYVPTLVAGATNVKLVLLIYVVSQGIVLFIYTMIPLLNPLPVTVIVSPPAGFAAVILPGYATVVIFTPPPNVLSVADAILSDVILSAIFFLFCIKVLFLL